MSLSLALAARLRLLHREVDARFDRTTAAIVEPIACKLGCASCCQDDLTIWKIEAEEIVSFVQERGGALVVHPEGACAFLDGQGGCQIHPARPYVCRSQGAVLTWWEEDEASPRGARRRRDTCPEHGLEVALESLPEAALFELGPAEQELIEIATAALVEAGERGLPERVGLRALAESLSSVEDAGVDQGQ